MHTSDFRSTWNAQLARFFRFVAEERFFASHGNWGTPARLRFYLDSLFRGIYLKDRRVLDVGAGTGIFSVYLSIMGAEKVYALEPEQAGSQEKGVQRFVALTKELRLSNIVLERKTIEDAVFVPDSFDLILLHNCVNHFDEQACAVLHQDAGAQRKYLETFRLLNRMSKSGGLLVIADCTRHNFFDWLGLKSPLAPSINWNIHQTPQIWDALANQAGFEREQLSWTTLGHFGRLGTWLLANRFAAFFLLGHYALRLRKVRDDHAVENSGAAANDQSAH